MFGKLRKFKRDDDGAVTVDWVVLTAAVGFIGIAVVTSIRNSATDVSSGIGAAVDKNGTKLLGP